MEAQEKPQEHRKPNLPLTRTDKGLNQTGINRQDK